MDQGWDSWKRHATHPVHQLFGNQGNHHDLISSLVACIIAVMAARMGVGSSGQALTTSANAGSSALLVESGKLTGKTLCSVDATPWSANDLRDWRIGL